MKHGNIQKIRGKNQNSRKDIVLNIRYLKFLKNEKTIDKTQKISHFFKNIDNIFLVYDHGFNLGISSR